MKSNFSAETITDAKRFVRGEQFLLAKRLIDERSISLQLNPAVLFLAGGDPGEEMGVIRKLWPRILRAYAVDRDRACVEAARAAGVPNVVHGDIGVLLDEDGPPSRPPSTFDLGLEPAKRPGSKATPSKKFDLVELDFCGLLDERMRATAVKAQNRILGMSRAMVLNFSYGHDGAAFFRRYARMTAGLWTDKEVRMSDPLPESALRLMERTGMIESLVGRLKYLMRGLSSSILRSVMLYQGKAVPMCSTLWEKCTYDYRYNSVEQGGFSFVRVNGDDLERAVLDFSAADLYALPEERVTAFRRRAAARKAVATRREQGRLVLPGLTERALAD